MGRESKLIKNTFILSLGTFLPKLASLVTLPTLTFFLTKTEMGSYDLIAVLVSLLLPAVTLQIETAAFRFLLEERGKNEEIKTIVSTIFAFIIPVSVVVLGIAWPFLRIADTQVKLLVCLYFLADIIINAARQVARGLGCNKEYSISAIAAAVLMTVLTIVFVKFLNLQLYGAVLALLLSTVASLILLCFMIRIFRYISFSAIKASKLKEFIQYSWPMVPNSMSMWVMRLSDRLVITGFLGLPMVAVYSVANRIPSILQLARRAFTYAWQENASIVSKDEDADAYYSAVFRNLFNLTAGFFGLLVCATPLLVVILIRGDYGEAYVQMPILFLSEFFYVLATFFGGIYIARKKTRSVGLTTVAAAVCNIVIDLLLVKKIGLFAASISTLVSYFLLFVFRAVGVQKIVKVRMDIKYMIIVFIVIMAEAALFMLQSTVWNIVNVVIGLTTFIILNRATIRMVLKRATGIVRRRKNR